MLKNSKKDGEPQTFIFFIIDVSSHRRRSHQWPPVGALWVGGGFAPLPSLPPHQHPTLRCASITKRPPGWWCLGKRSCVHQGHELLHP